MRIRLIVVGARQPSWVNEGFAHYARRLPKHWNFRLDTVASARRSKRSDAADAVEAEGQKILDKVRASERLILLDEHGSEMTSVALADKLAGWRAAGTDLCFVIGGPDGLSKACSRRADCRWSLSRLTLPHGLVRVLFAEQLYRAWAVSSGHPYHRA